MSGEVAPLLLQEPLPLSMMSGEVGRLWPRKLLLLMMNGEVVVKQLLQPLGLLVVIGLRRALPAEAASSRMEVG